MLPSLPEELLAHIFSYLALPPAARLVDIAEDRQGHSIEDIRAWKNMQLTQQTLFNICLSSKTLYRLAWPTLYSAYSTWLVSEGSTSSANGAIESAEGKWKSRARSLEPRIAFKVSLR